MLGKMRRRGRADKNAAVDASAEVVASIKRPPNILVKPKYFVPCRLIAVPLISMTATHSERAATHAHQAYGALLSEILQCRLAPGTKITISA
jgi:hypothetical protein